MDLPLFWVDAFTDRVFGGNPAAIIPLESWLETALMQRIAFQNGLSETAFIVRTGPAAYDLRWFTPRVEVDLCGHATLAAAHALFEGLGQTGEQIAFSTRSGILTVTRRGSRLELDFPAQPAAPTPPTAALRLALGEVPRQTLQYPGRWLCVYDTAAQVAALAPTLDRFLPVLPGRVVVTAPGTDCDFVSRFFAPDAGILEDPVTGSAHCTLVPYWAARLGKDRLHARQISERGGELWCELAGERVRLAGHGALYLTGRIRV
jgi:predicted PhzF superfamily epimerase YddE/YHI9